ncbi:DUF3693 domain-containing protein [Xylella fastidiosa]|uniref:DUF3693 domain-containing protein n=1 Tax=Xylella fastidiosa TaxID=2371 RepID=UPI0009B5B7DE|nr:DUF3693 domain-containing protein [Xylella fastidiosa]
MQQKLLIDLAIQHSLRNSLRGLAEQINVSSGVLSEWRNEIKPIPNERIAQICKIAETDGATWMAKIHAEKAQSPIERAIWKSMLERLTATAATLLIGAGITYPTPSQAHALDKNFSNGISHNAYYVHQVDAYKARCLASPKNGV